MRIWYEYRKSDGTFTGASHQALNFEDIAGNENEQIGLREGVEDWLSQRVDGDRLVDYQPPAPSDEEEWDPTTKRHVLKAEALLKRIAKLNIDRTEGPSLRTMREAIVELAAMLAATGKKAAKDGAIDRVVRLNTEITEIAVSSGLRSK